VIPKPVFLLAVGLAVIPIVAGFWVPEMTYLGLAANLLIVLAAMIDLLLTPSPREIEVSREVSEVLSVGAPNPVVLQLLNRGRVDIDIEVTDEFPEPGRADDLPIAARLPTWKETTATYHVVPQHRGYNRFSAVHLRYRSRLGLWMRDQRRPMETSVKIYPDIRMVRRFDLLARKNRLAEMGLKLWRLKGREGEFERLREYRREDELRHVDWKATAKYQRLISREYTVERNQNIVFLLDCGRSMSNETGGISHFDRGLNAAIILSYIALGQGDNVSLLAFSNRVERAAGPVRGKPAVRVLIRQCFDLEPRLEASDYGLACEDLMRRQSKRSLVILITYAIDDQHLASIGRYLRALVSPHLFLIAFLRDVALADLAAKIPDTDAEAYRVAAAAEMMAAQARRVAKLRDSGILVLETPPNELSAELINQYLDLKARHLL
jgi:uncharacterized protein (DUF58 family)